MGRGREIEKESNIQRKREFFQKKDEKQTEIERALKGSYKNWVDSVQIRYMWDSMNTKATRPREKNKKHSREWNTQRME